MLGRITAVSSSQYSSSGSVAFERPDDVDRLALRLAAPPDEPVGLVRLQQPRVADVQPDPLERRDRQGGLEDRHLHLLVLAGSGLGGRDRRADRPRRVGRRPALDVLDVVGDVLLDPEPDEARVVRVGEDRPADRLGEVARVAEQRRQPGRHLALERVALRGDLGHLVGLAGRLDRPLLDELDVPLEWRRRGDLAPERVVGEAVEEARRERGADRRHEHEHDEAEDRDAAVPEAADRQAERRHLLVPRAQDGADAGPPDLAGDDRDRHDEEDDRERRRAAPSRPTGRRSSGSGRRPGPWR